MPMSLSAASMFIVPSSARTASSLWTCGLSSRCRSMATVSMRALEPFAAARALRSACHSLTALSPARSAGVVSNVVSMFPTCRIVSFIWLRFMSQNLSKVFRRSGLRFQPSEWTARSYSAPRCAVHHSRAALTVAPT